MLPPMWTTVHTREGDTDVSTLTGSDARERPFVLRVVRNTTTPIWVRLELAGSVVLDGAWPGVRDTGTAVALRDDAELRRLSELCDQAERVRAALFHRYGDDMIDLATVLGVLHHHALGPSGQVANDSSPGLAGALEAARREASTAESVPYAAAAMMHAGALTIAKDRLDEAVAAIEKWAADPLRDQRAAQVAVLAAVYVERAVAWDLVNASLGYEPIGP